MTTNESPLLRQPFKLRHDAAARKASAIRIAELLVDDPVIVDVHMRELLSVAIWKYTEADGGKFGCRYRSAGVLDSHLSKIQHEHVIPRKELIQLIRAHPADIENILSTATGCLVTVDEHARLNAIRDGTTGWERYRLAGVDVFDMAAASPTPWQPWLHDDAQTRPATHPRSEGASKRSAPVIPVPATREVQATEVQPGDVLVYGRGAHEVQKVRILTKWVQYTEPDGHILYRRVTSKVQIKRPA